MADTFPMQADGKGSNGAKAAPDAQDGVLPESAGQSGGGAQAGERHGRKEGDDPGYHGPGQLGNETTPGGSGGQGG